MYLKTLIYVLIFIENVVLVAKVIFTLCLKRCHFAEGLVKLKERARTRKGRGFGSDDRPERKDKGRYEAVEDATGDEPGPQRCE